MITREQIRAARAILEWTQLELADLSHLSKTAIVNIEKGIHRPSPANAHAIQAAFEHHGIEFIDGGVRQRRDFIEVYEGTQGIEKFYRSVMGVAASQGGNFYVYGVNEQDFTTAAIKAGINDEYRTTMSGIKNIKFHVLIKESDTNTLSAEHCTYAKLPDDLVFTKAPFYIYGDRLALIVWRKPPKFIIIKDHDLVEAYKTQFQTLWKQAKVLSERA